MLTTPAVVAESIGLHHIEERKLGHFFDPGIDLAHFWPPKSIASPRVKAPVIACLLDRVEDVAELHDMAAETAVANVDARARHVVDRAVTDGDVLRDVDLDSGRLFLHPAREMNEAIVHEAICRIVARERAGSAIDLFQLVDLIVIKERAANGFWVADETDTTGTRLKNFAAANRDAPVVVVHEYGVAAELIQKRILQTAILSSIEKNSATTIDCPVGSQKRFLGIHDRPRGVAKGESLQRDKLHRLFFIAAEFHQRP